MTTYCLNPNETWLAVYTLNTGTMPTNNVVFSEITANLTANATSITVKTGEGALFTQWMIATLEQLQADWKTATAREVVLISWISWDTLTLTRWYENCVMDDTASPKVLWNTKQAFTSWARISVYVSRALLNWVQTRLQQVNCPCNTSVYNQEMALTSCIANNCDDWRDALYKEKARRCYNDCWFWDWSLWDCVISEDAFLCANCNYNFKNLTICSWVLVRFRWAGIPRINVQRKFCNMWTIDLRWWDYVWACSKKDCITGCTVSNNYCSVCYNSMCFGCWGAWWFGCWWIHCGCAGCNATWSWWGAWWKWGTWHYCYRSSSWSTNESYDTEWADWSPAVWYNWGDGWEWGWGWWSYGWDATSANYAWWGWGWWGWYLTWNWGNWWKWWSIYKWILYWQWWTWGNGWIFGRWWDWWQATTNSNGCAYDATHLMWGNGWNGYIGWNWWYGWSYSQSASNSKWWWGGWNGWKWIICWWNWWAPFRWNWGCKTWWRWWDAINNMYGLIIHACEYYNNCIEAKWWDWWAWWNAEATTCSWRHWWGYWNVWGCAGNGWKVSVVYVKLLQAWNINTAWWTWGCWWITYQDDVDWVRCANGANWTAGWSKVCKPF